MRTKPFFLLLAFTLAFSSACHKEGSGGKAGISGRVLHHSTPIPGAVVYIKYGATEFPGTDPSLYDAQVAADANAHYEIRDLYKGDYYLYGIGYDNAISATVRGGTHIDLKKNQDYTLDIPVTE